MYVLSFPDELRRNFVTLENCTPTKALQIMRHAHRYAVCAGVDSWEFAVEIDEFHRAQISNSDLRWLLSQGLARHANEVASTNGKRGFQPEESCLNGSSCFIVTDAGLKLLESLEPSTALAVPGFIDHWPLHTGTSGEIIRRRRSDQEVPFWDAKRGELRVGEQLVKRFRRPSPSQQLILDAFEAACWPARIADPLPLRGAHCPKRCLHDAVKRLNRHHLLQAIRFRGDGSGRGVVWECIV